MSRYIELKAVFDGDWNGLTARQVNRVYRYIRLFEYLFIKGV